MTVRQLRPGEGEIFRHIRVEALRADAAAFASRAEAWETLPADEPESRLSSNPVFVSFDGDTPVELVGLLCRVPSKMAHRASVTMLYVRSSHRRQGRGTALTSALEAKARGLGVRQLELAVSAENRGALEFYERLGYRVIGRIPGGFLHEGREIDEHLMVRRLGA